MYKKPLRPNELFHHGVKGQKWGVRNGPPYPIEDKVLAKGTRLNSVVGTFNPNKHPMAMTDPNWKNKFYDAYVTERYIANRGDKWMYTYRPDEKHDTKIYEGPFAKYLVLGRGAEVVVKHEMETIKDLSMPNKKERIGEFSNLAKSKKFGKQVKKDLKEVQDMLVKQNIGNEKEREAYRNFNTKKFNPDDAQQLKVAYDMFSHAMENIPRYKSTMQYASNMSKKYDAMVDDNNQGVYNRARDPIIIFRAAEALKKVGDNHIVTGADTLTYDQIEKAYNYVKKELEKEGEHVKL